MLFVLHSTYADVGDVGIRQVLLQEVASDFNLRTRCFNHLLHTTYSNVGRNVPNGTIPTLQKGLIAAAILLAELFNLDSFRAVQHALQAVSDDIIHRVETASTSALLFALTSALLDIALILKFLLDLRLFLL